MELADAILAAFIAGVKMSATQEAKKAGKNVVKGGVGLGADLVRSGASVARGGPLKPPKKGQKRKPSLYSRMYGKKFKELAEANKKKDGSWKKDGFKKTQKQAHAATRKEMKK